MRQHFDRRPNAYGIDTSAAAGFDNNTTVGNVATTGISSFGVDATGDNVTLNAGNV